MNALIQHLQKHLSGEVMASDDALRYFATDGSIFKLTPKLVVYPRNSSDVKNAVRFSYQLAQRGKRLPITARGRGTDQAGAALGEGMMMVFPAHMKKLVSLDKETVTVQPGIPYGELQRILHTHGRFLPPYPSSIDFSTIGGAVANNASGEKTIKYGSTRDYVQSLQVVLADGKQITAQRLTKKELQAKKGLTDLEGEIYRKLDGLLIDNAKLIEKSRPNVSKNSAGYALWEVRGKDGSFDLSKLLVGSQGTLGIVTEVTLRTVAYNPKTHLIVAFFDDLEKAGEAVLKLRGLKPSAMEIVDYYLLEFLEKHHPQQLANIIKGELPKIVLLVEFDDLKDKLREKTAKRAQRLLNGLATSQYLTVKPAEQEQLWKIRHSAAAVIWMDEGKKKALPIIEDAVVPVERMSEFLDKVYELFKKHKLEIAVWGHAGNANFHMQPFLDLGNVGDRQLAFKLMEEFYRMVIELGGSTCGEHNDGRLRAPYLSDVYGQQVYGLFEEVKQIFDPHNILNPGVKIGVTREDLVPLLRDEYSMEHLYDHLPRS